MKIIKKGTIPPEQLSWWMKQILTCKNCGTECQLDKDDHPAHGGERHPGGAQWVQAFCPLCKASIIEARKSENDQVQQPHGRGKTQPEE